MKRIALAGIVLGAASLGTSTSAQPAIDLATFECPNALPNREVFQRVITRQNLTIAVASEAKEHKPFATLCLSDGCLTSQQHLQYSFGRIEFLQNGQSVKPNSRFSVLYEKDAAANTAQGIRFDASKRYLVIVASLGIQGMGEFSLNAACELSPEREQTR